MKNISEVEYFVDNISLHKKKSRRGIGISKKMGISIFAVLIAGTLIASGALLTYYGKIETTATVEQSVQIRSGGIDTWHNWNEPVAGFTIPDAPGGESFCFKFWVWNKASVEAGIFFKHRTSAEDGSGISMDSDGVDTQVYAFPTESTILELRSKNSSWQVDDRMKACLTFNPMSPTFDYDLTAEALEKDTEYALIYYPDQKDRFASDKWNGDGGMVICTFTSDSDGRYSVQDQSTDLGRNMPDETDWNIHPSPDYCDGHNGYDDYNHGEGGAKIWIVPTADLTDGKSLPLVSWHPEQYLFETDLISYSDCDLLPVPWTMSLWGTPITEATILSGAKVPFFVCYAFDIGIMPGTYTMETFVNVQ